MIFMNDLWLAQLVRWSSVITCLVVAIVSVAIKLHRMLSTPHRPEIDRATLKMFDMLGDCPKCGSPQRLQHVENDYTHSDTIKFEIVTSNGKYLMRRECTRCDAVFYQLPLDALQGPPDQEKQGQLSLAQHIGLAIREVRE